MKEISKDLMTGLKGHTSYASELEGKVFITERHAFIPGNGLDWLTWELFTMVTRTDRR